MAPTAVFPSTWDVATPIAFASPGLLQVGGRRAWVSSSLPARGLGGLCKEHLRQRRAACIPLVVRGKPVASPPVCSAQLDEPLGGNSLRMAPSRWGEGMRNDVLRRMPLYVRDWTDGFRLKSIPAVLFLFFACLAPVTAFGALNAVVTGGSLGVVECIVSCGSCGMMYAAFSGQPLTFLAPTGLTLAFTAALYGATSAAGLAFLPTYAWVGIWTSIILATLALVNACDLIKYCTRFTDDIFNSLIATNFLYEASRTLLAAFVIAGPDKTLAFASLSIALATLLIARALSGMRSSRFLFRRARNVLSDFGPCLAIASVTAVACIPAISSMGLARLAIPTSFALAGGRPWLVPILSVPLTVRLLCIVPAMLLTCLFFLDQNISVRVVNSPAHRLRKGPAYHLDMVILALCTFLCSIFGLPLMCAGTVQSLNHVKALTKFEQIVDKDGNLTGEEKVVSVQENRLTGFAIHGLVLSSLLLLPVLQQIPMAVVSGIFLFLGYNMLSGNEFLARVPVLFMDPTRYPPSMPSIAPKQTNKYTVLQLACLGLLWALKLNRRTAMYFPAVIGTLMLIRSRIAPRLFSEVELNALDSAVVEEDTATNATEPDRKLAI